jgi:hypothetical protein
MRMGKLWPASREVFAFRSGNAGRTEMGKVMATEDKSDIRLLLEKALERGPQEKVASGIRAQLAPHRDLIVKALRNGYSATSLARYFKENGIDASVDTLRAYVGEVAGKKRKKPSAQKAAKPSSRTRAETKEKPREKIVSEPRPETHPTSEAKTAQSDDSSFHAALKRKL